MGPGPARASGAIARVTAAARHCFAVHNWLYASYRSAQLTAEGAERAGPALTRAMPSGEVVTVFANDVMRLGGLYDVMGRFAGAVASYVVVGRSCSPPRPRSGWLVLAGGPVMLASLTLIVRPLQRRQALQREEAGRLTTLGADTVAGLRVLRGIGGEQTFLRRYEEQSQKVRHRGVHVAGIQAALDSAQVLLPGIFVVLVTWLGARQAVAGEITAGQLVAFYGYTAFLTMPLQTAIEIVDRGIRAQIAAGKVLRVLAVQPDHDADAPGHRAAPGATTPTWSTRSPAPSSAAACSPRSSRRDPRSRRPSPTGSVATAPARTRRRGAARRLDDLAIADVRRRVVVSEPDPRLFTGVLRDQLSAPATAGARAATDDRRERRRARAAGSRRRAPSTCSTPSPDGLDGTVEERGRSYSGGQRQRLALARALLTDAPVLVLVEPTSAVDAHTEARIAERLADAPARPHHRASTTVSPLLLGQADEVVLARGRPRQPPRGTHRELLDHAGIPRTSCCARRTSDASRSSTGRTDHARRTLPIADCAARSGSTPAG